MRKIIHFLTPDLTFPHFYFSFFEMWAAVCWAAVLLLCWQAERCVWQVMITGQCLKSSQPVCFTLRVYQKARSYSVVRPGPVLLQPTGEVTNIQSSHKHAWVDMQACEHFTGTEMLQAHNRSITQIQIYTTRQCLSRVTKPWVWIYIWRPTNLFSCP